MPKRIAISTLNASTMDILNVIRQNANAEYQSAVPEITSEHDIPRVGEVIYGNPSLSNYFINALVNRIALVKVKSANFNNMYKELKKGYLEFGETVEEVFVNIAKAREFSVEKAESREFKRTVPDVRSAFHAMNWRVQYPVTIQDQDLRQAFLSMEGVQDLITRITDSVYQANEYDEFLLFKYLMIKAITKGKMYPVSIGDGTKLEDAAVAFRSMSNQLGFISTKYNASGVHTSTPREDQYIFMDAEFNAQFDVNNLASAFNMDKANFIGRLNLIDDWTTFDNDRFAEITANTDMIEKVTDEELALMKGVKAVLLDKEWFQVYDNLDKFTEQYSGSGMYWNYFYNVWKTISSSPFSNAIVFVTDSVDTTLPSTINVTVTDKSASDDVTILTLGVTEKDSVASQELQFTQTKDLTTQGIAVHQYGAVIIPKAQASTAITLEATVQGTKYVGKTTVSSASAVGDAVVMEKQA
jgi:hypothetical protein